MGTHTGNVITLANSIIGVSVLAMPFCFKQCGILLSILMLLFSSIISRLACHYLMKSAIMEKRKNFEMLAFRAFGPTGKLMTELCIIGFMLGTCVAYFVIMGDLGPAIIAPVLGYEHPTALRPSILIAVAVFVVLPLGLLKNVDSLSGICAVTVAFYFCLVLKVLGEAALHLLSWDWPDKVFYWRPSGVLQCIPIFSMALSCQTQLFEIFDSLTSTPLDRMNSVVRSAVNMATLFYISVGLFGYIAYCNQTFTGNLLMSFSPTLTSDVIKMGFVLSVAVSFPLVIFPCRASIYSLFFSKGYEMAQSGSAHIPEPRFQCITLVIVTVSLVIGLVIPNIEVVLGLVGSTIGVIICVIVPGVIFLSLTSRDNNERLIAKWLVTVGLVIMVLGTYANLYVSEEAMSGADPPRSLQSRDRAHTQPPPLSLSQLDKVNIKDETLQSIKDIKDLSNALSELKKPENIPEVGVMVKPVEPAKKEAKVESVPFVPSVNKMEDSKKEPPVPEEPVEKKKAAVVRQAAAEEKKADIIDVLPAMEVKKADKVDVLPAMEVKKVDKVDVLPAMEVKKVDKVSLENEVLVDKKAIEKEESEMKKETEKTKKIGNKESIKQEILLEKLKQHEEAQKKLNEEGKKILKEIKEVVREETVNSNGSKDAMKVVHLKTGAVVNVAEIEKKMKGNGEERREGAGMGGESSIVRKMASGLPLPLAINGLKEGAKNRVEQGGNKKPGLEQEAVVNKKEEEGGSPAEEKQEEREKRDVEEVEKEAVVEEQEQPSKQAESVVAQNNGPAPDTQPQDKEDVHPESGAAKYTSIAGHQTDEKENCKKNDTSREKIEKLIKTPVYLSDPKQILDESPRLLNSPAGGLQQDGMPKKRDLKSVGSDQPETKAKHLK